MYAAYDTVEQWVTEGEDLWLLDPVDEDRYVCCACGVKVWPKSYRIDNKHRPYFWIPASKRPQHLRGCLRADVAGRQVGRGREHQDVYTGAYPNRLTLRHAANHAIIRPVERPASGGPAEPGGLMRLRGQGPVLLPRGPHEAGSIRALCRAVVHGEVGKAHPLIVPGVAGQTYGDCFSELPSQEIERQPQLKIYYAPMRWVDAPIESAGELVILLHAGEWEAGNRRQPALPYRLRINWRKWPAGRKEAVRKEIGVVQEEGRAAYRREEQSQPWTFFLAGQDQEDPSIFETDDFRCVCFLMWGD